MQLFLYAPFQKIKEVHNKILNVLADTRNEQISRYVHRRAGVITLQ